VSVIFWLGVIVLPLGVLSSARVGSVWVETTADVEFEGIPENTNPMTAGTQIEVPIEDPTLGQRALAIGIEYLPLAVGLAVLWLLRGFTLSIKTGSPFIAANVRRLRWIGAILLIAPPAIAVATRVMTQTLVESVPGVPYVSHSFELFAGWELLSGLVAFVLAEVFAHGVRLREDVEATI
jgi:hypothetical protein